MNKPINETDNSFCCIFMLIVLFCVVVYLSRQTKHHQCCNKMFGVDTPQNAANTLHLCKKKLESNPPRQPKKLREQICY